MNKPLQIAGTQDYGRAFHAIYTNPRMMREWLECAGDTRARLDRALHCLRVAQAPGYRFQLESVPSEVKAVIESFLAECSAAAEPVREHVRVSRSRGLAWDTVWSSLPERLEAHGFHYGDAALLGVADVALGGLV